MASKAPPLRGVKMPSGSKAPPVSRTQDNYTHHTSPVSGPQPGPPEMNPETSAPRARIKTMPDVPAHVTKHPNPVGRPKNRNDA
ncbi:hypothetical protein ABIG06_006253 [Bradyrhizobium sp. USDA 326]|uniref:hypothetical protein n=1 Tax=unclassified Bradyrhizobium TaxID=2631580 RepID=UPI0035160DA6